MTMTIDGSNGFSLDGQFNSASSFGFKNRIINGAMMIDQRNAGASVTVTASAPYTVDRWRAFQSTDGAATMQQVADAPSGFSNSLKWTTTTADGSLAAGQYAGLDQKIEGFNTADLAFGTISASTITISFWVKSSLTGTFGGALANGAFNRSYPFTYVINSANTWEQKTVTIAGDTTGTWIGATNGTGLWVQFGLGVGSTYSGTAGSWAANGYISATGAVSVIGTLNATWQVTGVQLEKGSTATSFDYRPYGTELQLCKRYTQVMRSNATTTTGIANVGCLSTTRAYGGVLLEMEMRASPTITFSAANTFNTRNNSGTALTVTSITALNANTYSFDLDVSVASGLAAGDCSSASMVAGTSGLITISSEL